MSTMKMTLVLYQRGGGGRGGGSHSRRVLASFQGFASSAVGGTANDHEQRIHNDYSHRRSFHSSRPNCLGTSFQSKESSSSSSQSSLSSKTKFSDTSQLKNSFQHFQAMFKSTLTPPKENEATDGDITTGTKSVPKKSLSKMDGFLKDLGLPTLVPEWRKMFHKDTVFNDISAGLTVGCIAVPLSLAIAVASGVPAQVGLVTAAVSGVAGGLMGGTTLAITGPAAAISLLIVDAVQTHGLEALPFITLACGGLQLASGVTRVGVVAKLVPVSVIAGFTTGVGTLILSTQFPKALGMASTAGLNPIEVMSFIGSNLSAINPSAAALAVGTSAAMFYLPKIHPAIPSALMAVGGATLATHTLGLDVSMIGSIPSRLEAFQFGIPIIPSVESLPSLCTTVTLIYAMTSVESLLSCAALEKMKKTSYKHNPDQELVGQGLANMASSMFMGMPVTSVIARSSLNVRLNANSRLPALVQAGFVFSSVVFLSDKIAMIPMPALSGVLITTGMGMLNPTEFKHCYAVQKIDAIPFAATIGGMVSMGLAEGIGLGCVTAAVIHHRDWTASTSTLKQNSAETYKQLRRMKAEEASGIYHAAPILHNHDHYQEDSHHDGVSALATHGSHSTFQEHHPRSSELQMHYTTNVQQTGDRWYFSDSNGQDFIMDPKSSSVWNMQGPINFLSMFAIDDFIRTVKEDGSSKVVLDMNGVTSLEFTGVEELTTRLLADVRSESISMVNCSDALHDVMDQCDPNKQIARYSNLVCAAQR